MTRPLGSVALPAARSESCALEPTLCAQGSSDIERKSSDRPGDPGWTAAARKESWMTRPFRLKFANFMRAQKYQGAGEPLENTRGLFGSQSEISGLTLARKPRRKTQPGFSVNQSQSHQSYTTSSTRACVRTPASRRVFPILLISRQSFTHGCPRVDPGYGDSEPCLCARYAFHLTTTCICLRLRSTDYCHIGGVEDFFWLFLSSTPACVSFRVS